MKLFDKLRFHFMMWNRWRKVNFNSKFHKLLVLLGLRYSSSLKSMKAAALFIEGFKIGLVGSTKEVGEALKDIMSKMGASAAAAAENFNKLSNKTRGEKDE